MDGPVPDARTVPMPPRDLPRIRPVQVAVWIRAEQAWKKGWIAVMVFHRGRWLIWAQHDCDGTDPWTRWGWFVFESGEHATIRARIGDAPPPE